MADTTLQLGDFVFADFEIPEEITFGGEQALTVHKLVGGARVVDAMGADDQPLDWSGRLRGPQALQRALYLDNLRKAGKPLKLTWSALAYTVIVRRFSCVFQRAYELPYAISCEVVNDDTAPVTSAPSITVDAQVGDDMDAAGVLADDVGDDELNSNLSNVSTAIAAFPSFVGATRAQLASVLAPLSIAQARVATLAVGANATVSAGSTFCGVLAGGAGQAAMLLGYESGMTTLAALTDLANLLERISTNISADGASGAVLTVAGGSLYALASEAYGDPAEWSTLAEANGLTDPILSGVNTLRIPSQPDGAGGVWQA